MTNDRPKEWETVSETTSRLGRPNITSPNPRAQSVRNTPTTPAPRWNTVSRADGAVTIGVGAAVASTDGRAKLTHFAADLPFVSVANFASQREYVSRHDAAVVDEDISRDGNQIALQMTIDIGIALHDQEVTVHRLVGAEREISETSGAVGDRDMHDPIAGTQRGRESRLDLRRLAQVTQVNGWAAVLRRRDGLWRGARLLSRGVGECRDVGDETPEIVNERGRAGIIGIGRWNRRSSRDGGSRHP